MMKILALMSVLLLVDVAYADGVRVKDLGHFQGWRENALVGFGLVTGLAGSGDSAKSDATRQAIKNALGRLGANLTVDQIQSRNAALVIVTAVLPPSAHRGDKIDVSVSSAGDARSLAGGSLLMTPLQGPDQVVYALAQGSLVVGGYRFDADLSRQQKNFPTAGVIPGGATIEAQVSSPLVNDQNELTFILSVADTTTAERVADGINAAFGFKIATVVDSDTVKIRTNWPSDQMFHAIARIETLEVQPDTSARIVVNEKSGTVVAGGGVHISSVVISQGDLRVSVIAENQTVPPYLWGASDMGTGHGLIVTNSKIDVTSQRESAVAKFPNTTIADLVEGLHQQHVDTRDLIAVLQALKAAGALHAEIIVQ